MLSEQPCGTQRQPPREARLDTVKLERIVARGVLGRDSWAGGRGRTARLPRWRTRVNDGVSIPSSGRGSAWSLVPSLLYPWGR